MPNTSQPDSDYPESFANLFDQINIAYVYVYFVWSIIVALLDSIVFLFVNLIIDINIFIKLRETIEEKKKIHATFAIININAFEGIKKFIFRETFFSFHNQF